MSEGVAQEPRSSSSVADADCLKRSMKMLGNLWLTLSVITPASSLFIIVPGVVAVSGTGAFLSMVLGGVICLCMAFVFAELGSAFPYSGGAYAIVARIVGPLMGFVVMNVNIVTILLAPAVLALGMSSYLGALFPNLPAGPTAMATIALATAVSMLTVRVNAVVTGVFLAVEMLALLVLAILGVVHVGRSLADLVLHPVVLNSARAQLVSAPGVVIGMATSVALFAYDGYGAALYFGEETHQPERHVAKAILWALGITVATELLPLTAVLLGAPDLSALLRSDHMFSDFILSRGGSTMNTVISLGIALALFNAIIAGVLVAGRIVFSTGRDSVWPWGISGALTRIHKRFHSPWVATLVGGVCAMLACLLKENLLLVLSGSGITLIMSVLCVAALVGRVQQSTSGGQYRMPSFPLAPVVALLMMIYVAYTNWLDPAIGRTSLYATLFIAAASATYYLLVIRRGAGWALKAPSA